MNIIVAFGGKSVEHEISIISAMQVIEALETKYHVIPLYISKDNKFYHDKRMKNIDFFKSDKKKFSKRNLVKFKKKKDRFYMCGKRKIEFDMIFPIVHGKGSEDGSVLNYFKFNGYPIVGNNVSFYSLSQNKGLTKRVLDGLKINNTKYKVITRGEEYDREDFNFPCIVKPNNLGSSLGISVVYNFLELEKAISYVFKIDNEVIIEEYLNDSKEYNISVLNNEGKIEVSKIEQVNKEQIFTFEEKYLKGNKKKGMANNKRKVINTPLNKEVQKEIESIAKVIYKQLGASGVIRIDFLYKDKLYVNEINSIPGSYAYYLWEGKYDFLELLNIVIKEARRDNFFNNKSNELIERDLIFKLSK